jgi:hypothetical protein
MTLDLSKFHPVLPKPKLTAGILGGVVVAIATAILSAFGADLQATVVHLGNTDVTWQAVLTMLGSWFGTYAAPEHSAARMLEGFPEDDDGTTTLGTDATEYPPGGGSGPRGEAALND